MTNPTATLVEKVRSGDRRALAQAITLVESTRPDHRAEADAVLDALLPAAGAAIRVGISGAPGVGKSTFVETLGTHLTAHGMTVAVLAVDPSSARSGGSILGDKTRMTELARNPAAFIRPSPSRGTPGGVARRTREAMLLCEAAGFSVVLVETVGVGQAEIDVADMVDVFVLLVGPGAGDDLQAIKRGVMELADVIVVTKADGALADAACRAEADYAHAVGLLRPKHAVWAPPVVACSALTGRGVPEVWSAITACHAAMREAGALEVLRAEQAKAWLWTEVRHELLARLLAAPAVEQAAKAIERAVAAGQLAPAAGATAILAAYEAPAGDPPSS